MNDITRHRSAFTYHNLVNILENLGEADALLLRDVLFVCGVVAVILSSSTSANTQALLAPRLLQCHYYTTALTECSPPPRTV